MLHLFLFAASRTPHKPRCARLTLKWRQRWEDSAHKALPQQYARCQHEAKQAAQARRGIAAWRAVKAAAERGARGKAQRSALKRRSAKALQAPGAKKAECQRGAARVVIMSTAQRTHASMSREQMYIANVSSSRNKESQHLIEGIAEHCTK